MHIIAHGGCTDTVRETALEDVWEKNPVPHRGREPASILRLAFQSGALPTKGIPAQFVGSYMSPQSFNSRKHPKTTTTTTIMESKSCVKVEVAVPVPNSPHGLCRRKPTLEEEKTSELRSCVPNSPYDLCGRKATLNSGGVWKSRWPSWAPRP